MTLTLDRIKRDIEDIKNIKPSTSYRSIRGRLQSARARTQWEHTVYVAAFGKDPLIKVGYTTRYIHTRLTEIRKKYRFKRYVLFDEIDCTCLLQPPICPGRESDNNLWRCEKESLLLNMWKDSNYFNEFFTCESIEPFIQQLIIACKFSQGIQSFNRPNIGRW